MKSPQCRTRWHDHCVDPMCDCEHHREGRIYGVQKVVFIPDEYTEVIVEGPEPPPPYPEIVNRGKFRIAEEPPGTDLTAPWVLDYCLECRLPTWTHNHRVAEKHQSVCEDCAYRIVDGMAEERVKLENRRSQLPPHNPFA